jgi:hypothetical protein
MVLAWDFAYCRRRTQLKWQPQQLLLRDDDVSLRRERADVVRNAACGVSYGYRVRRCRRDAWDGRHPLRTHSRRCRARWRGLRRRYAPGRTRYRRAGIWSQDRRTKRNAGILRITHIEIEVYRRYTRHRRRRIDQLRRRYRRAAAVRRARSRSRPASASGDGREQRDPGEG